MEEIKAILESLVSNCLRASNAADVEEDKDEEKAANKKACNEEVDKRDIIRQIMIKLGRTDEDLELDAWIEGNERQNAKIVVQGNYNDIHNNGTVNNKG